MKMEEHDFDLDEFKLSLKEETNNTIKYGLLSYPEFFAEYPYEYHAVIYKKLKKDISKCSPWYTHKRIKKVLKHVNYYDSFEIVLLKQVTKKDKHKKEITALLQMADHIEDIYDSGYSFYDGRVLDNKYKDDRKSVWIDIFDFIYGRHYWDVLRDYLLWKAIKKYYEGVEAEEGKVKQVKQIMHMINLMDDNKLEECYTYFSDNYTGWWD